MFIEYQFHWRKTNTKMQDEPCETSSGSSLLSLQRSIQPTQVDSKNALSTGDTGGLHYIGNLL
jgi:hypothetical protein